VRLATWNCQSGTDGKVRAVLARYQPDILVVPESSSHPALATASLAAPAMPHAWVGSIPSKGLGVFGPTATHFDVLERSRDGSGELAVAISAEGDDWSANVLGVWTVPLAQKTWRSDYLCALDDIFRCHEDLLSDGNTVVAGDFNCWSRDPRDEFAQFMARTREEMGLVSAYHQWSSAGLGSETSMTHWWRGKERDGFHLDYVLVPASWTVTEVQIGSYDEWGAPGVPARSDHAPVVVDLHP
jgi:endonuclease/exonuclease/phosphatase family metal-dependent hydrolase